jgi:hypothetical protein
MELTSPQWPRCSELNHPVRTGLENFASISGFFSYFNREPAQMSATSRQSAAAL